MPEVIRRIGGGVVRAAGGAAPVAMFISPVRRFASIGFLGALVLILAGGWYVTRPARISRMAEGLLGNLLGGRVTVGSGHLSLSGTLLLSGVRVETQEEKGAAGVAGVYRRSRLRLGLIG